MQKADTEWNGRKQATDWTHGAHMTMTWRTTHLKTPLSLFLPLAADSVLLRSLSAAFLLHGRPFHRHESLNLDVRVRVFTFYRPRQKALTILSLRLMSSSSSFFLLSKWTSIRVCSSIRSFSILFRWMSCKQRFGTLDTLYILIGRLCFITGPPLTSKSTFSPSGIFGGMRLGMMNGLQGGGGKDQSLTEEHRGIWKVQCGVLKKCKQNRKSLTRFNRFSVH